MYISEIIFENTFLSLCKGESVRTVRCTWIFYEPTKNSNIFKVESLKLIINMCRAKHKILFLKKPPNALFDGYQEYFFFFYMFVVAIIWGLDELAWCKLHDKLPFMY